MNNFVIYKNIVNLKYNEIIDDLIIIEKEDNKLKLPVMYMVESNLVSNYLMYNKIFINNFEYTCIGDLKTKKIYGKNYINILSIGKRANIYVSLKKIFKNYEVNILFKYIAIAISDIVVINEISDIDIGLNELDVALDMGKNIYSIPGDIFNYRKYLANFSIKEGAIPICNAYDVKRIYL